MGSSRAPCETNVRHRRSWHCYCSWQRGVLKYRPGCGDETLRARDEDNHTEIAATGFVAGRSNAGVHDDAGDITTTKDAAYNTGRHFAELDHHIDRRGTRCRWSRWWHTAVRVRQTHPVVAGPRI
jgi:hypothetical protein